uniref:Uncharacterized protein n=1 Tax=Auxenochlorella protothecoides TaxID=3075 RepID=A0A1D2AC17_AUXPR
MQLGAQVVRNFHPARADTLCGDLHCPLMHWKDHTHLLPPHPKTHQASELPSVDPQLAAWVDLQVHPDTQLPKEKLAQLEAIGLGRGCRPAAARRPLKQLA